MSRAAGFSPLLQPDLWENWVQIWRAPMKNKIRPFLMFEGKADEAMNFYVSLFPRAEVTQVNRWGANQPGKEGSIKTAVFEIGGQSVMCTDSPVKHAFTFTPASSLFVECESEAELDRLYAAL